MQFFAKWIQDCNNAYLVTLFCVHCSQFSCWSYLYHWCCLPFCLQSEPNSLPFLKQQVQYILFLVLCDCSNNNNNNNNNRFYRQTYAVLCIRNNLYMLCRIHYSLLLYFVLCYVLIGLVQSCSQSKVC